MHFLYKKQFLKQFDRLPTHEQNLARETDQQIRQYYQTQKGSFGLRIKLLYRGTKGRVYEARVSENLRLLWAEQKDLVAFVLVGTHNEVKNFLRNLL